MKGILYQRRNSKSSQSGETNKTQQLDQTTKKYSNIQQMNEQLQKLRQTYQQTNSRNDQLVENSSTKKIHFQESSPQGEQDSIHSPFSFNQNQQIQQMISPIQAAPPSNQHSFKSLPQVTGNAQQIEIKELNMKIQEYAKSNQILIERNAILENDLLLQRNQNNVLIHSNSNSNGIGSLNNTSNSLNLDRQLQAALIDKLRLEEIIEFMKEESEKILEEMSLYKGKSEMLEKELKDTSQSAFQNQNQVQAFFSQNKKIEDQLKLSNIHFVNAQKKLSSLEKENKELNEKLNLVEQEKKKISQKWQAASLNRKQEEKLKQRVKELEIELTDKQNECEEYKKKYVSTNTELRVYKEGEFNYKDIVESKFKELKVKWQEEFKQKEELLKQNNELLTQLEQFSNELSKLQQKCEKYQNDNANLIALNEKLQQKSEQLQTFVSAKQELQHEINQSTLLTREELTKRLQQANQEISNLIKLNEESNQQILTLQQDKHIMNKQIEEFLKQNEQLQDALNSMLNENQQEQELLSHLTSKNAQGSGNKNQSQLNISGNGGCNNLNDVDEEVNKHTAAGRQYDINLTKFVFDSPEYHKLIECIENLESTSLVEEIKSKINSLIQCCAASAKALQNKASGLISVCSECNKQFITANTMGQESLSKGFEKQYYEVKNLYDRLLIKHFNLQKKHSSLEDSMKQQKHFGNSSLQASNNYIHQIQPQDGSFEESHDQKTLNGSTYKSGGGYLQYQQNQLEGMNDSFESVKHMPANIFNSKGSVGPANNIALQSSSGVIIYPSTTNPLGGNDTLLQAQQTQNLHNGKEQADSDLQKNNLFSTNMNQTLNKSYNFTSTLNQTNTNLIQNILKNDFKIKEALSDNSQKMLNTILNKFLVSQGLNSSQLMNSNQKSKNSKSSGNLNETGSSTRLHNSLSRGGGNTADYQQQQSLVRGGPPTRTLERSLLRRNKSKENYQLNNSSSHLNHTSHNSSNNAMLNQSVDTYQKRYQDHLLNSSSSQHHKNQININNFNSVQTPYTHHMKQRKNSNSNNQISGTPGNTSVSGGYSSIHQMNRSFDGSQQSGSKVNNSSYSKFIKRKAGQQQQIQYLNGNSSASSGANNNNNNQYINNFNNYSSNGKNNSNHLNQQQMDQQMQKVNEFQYQNNQSYQY